MMLRRGFVCATALLAAGPAAVPTGPAASSAGPGENLLDLFTDKAAARALGRHALLAMPGAEAGALAAALDRQLAGPGPLRDRAAAAARRDFAAGRVACVDGWVLATVEARLCALVALSAGSGSTSACAPVA